MSLCRKSSIEILHSKNCCFPYKNPQTIIGEQSVSLPSPATSVHSTTTILPISESHEGVEIQATKAVPISSPQSHEDLNEHASQATVETTRAQMVGPDIRKSVRLEKRSSFDRIFRAEVTHPSIEEVERQGVLFRTLGWCSQVQKIYRLVCRCECWTFKPCFVFASVKELPWEDE